MTRKFHLKGLAVLGIFACLLLACEKEEVRPEFRQMTFESQEVLDKLPEGLTNSDDSYAMECVSMINDALDMSEFVGDMEVPDGAVKTARKSSGDTWTWTVNAQGHTYSFYWTYSDDSEKHYWTMEIEVDGSDKYAYIQAWEYKDGSGGQVKYNFNWVAAVYGSTDFDEIFWTYTWDLDDSGNYHFTMTWDGSEEGYDFYIEYAIVVNEDGSGSIQYWLMEELVYEMVWDAQGNGTWIFYSGGQEFMSGSWTAA